MARPVRALPPGGAAGRLEGRPGAGERWRERGRGGAGGRACEAAFPTQPRPAELPSPGRASPFLPAAGCARRQRPGAPCLQSHPESCIFLPGTPTRPEVSLGAQVGRREEGAGYVGVLPPTCSDLACTARRAEPGRGPVYTPAPSPRISRIRQLFCNLLWVNQEENYSTQMARGLNSLDEDADCRNKLVYV